MRKEVPKSIVNYLKKLLLIFWQSGLCCLNLFGVIRRVEQVIHRRPSLLTGHIDTLTHLFLFGDRFIHLFVSILPVTRRFYWILRVVVPQIGTDKDSIQQKYAHLASL